MRMQFKIKTLVVLTFFAGLASLVGSFANTSFQQAKIVKKLGGGKVLYDFEFKDGKTIRDPAPQGPAWIRERLGPRFFSRVTFVDLVGWEINDLSSIYYLHQLEHLTIFNCDSLESVKSIEHFQKLTYLDLAQCDLLSDLSSLDQSRQLKHLDLFACKSVKDLSCLNQHSNLEFLNVSNCTQLLELDFLQGLENLREFRFSKSTMSSVKPLAKNSKLQKLFLDDSPKLESLDGLEDLTDLQLVDLRGCKMLSLAEVKRLKIARPETSIISDY